MILRRIEGERFSEVRPLWKGWTAIILGGGPSLTPEQFARAKVAHDDGVRVVAVNASYLRAPWAECVYFADSHFWRWHEVGIDMPGLGLKAADVRGRFAAFAGQKCTIQNSGANVTDAAVHMMRNRDFPAHGEGLSLDPRYLVTGRNSGFQALNLAVLAGAKRVILLGFDGAPAADGKTHFHGGHPRPTPREAYPLYRSAMVAAAAALCDAGVEVLNCSAESAITTFPKVTLEEALARS